MAMGRRFELMAMALVALASLAAPISCQSLEEITKLSKLLATTNRPPGIDSYYEIVKLNVGQLGVAKKLMKMFEGTECESDKIISEMLEYFEKNPEDKPMRELAKYASEKYLDRCKDEYKMKLGSAISNIEQTKRVELLEYMMNFLEQNFIKDFFKQNTDVREKIAMKQDPAFYLDKSKNLIHDSGLTFDMVIRNCFEGCKEYVSQSEPTMKSIRNLSALLQDYQLKGFSDEFIDNVFRYNFCEDLKAWREFQGAMNSVSQLDQMKELSKVLAQTLRDPTSESYYKIVKANVVRLPPVAIEIEKMADGYLCESEATISVMFEYLKHNRADEPMRELAKYVSEKYVKACREFIEYIVKQKILALEPSRREEMMAVLNNGFIKTFFDSNKGFDAKLNKKLATGYYLQNTRKNIMHAGMNMTLIWRLEGCDEYLFRLEPLIRLVRELSVLLQDYKLEGFSDDFIATVFRYNYCEDLVACIENQTYGRIFKNYYPYP